jgi:glycosyltransferase involved in cell wall biosynthesis
MNSRLKVALIFNFNPKWMGGIIYLINISRILKFLPEDKKPELLVFYPKHLQKFVDEIDYPFTQKIEWNFMPIHSTFLKSFIFRKNLFIDDITKQYKPDVFFPLHNYPIKAKKYPSELCWYADLQHKYYPAFFSWFKRAERNLRIKFILNNSRDIVVSSEAVKDDFYKFFKIPKNLKFHVYHFVSIIEGLPQIELGHLLDKYKLPEKYFIISNQFHKHKNHKVAFEAVAALKNNGVHIHLAITGRFPSDKNSPYLSELNQIIAENALQDQIHFLGLIPREDQLLLIKNAQAVIQPSLFEGWSTVIEDARSLQVPVIATDLPVNIEQLQSKGHYFSAHDDQKLADILHGFAERNFEELIYEPYEQRMLTAANELLKIFENSIKA